MPGDANEHMDVCRLQFFGGEVTLKRLCGLKLLVEGIALGNEFTGGVGPNAAQSRATTKEDAVIKRRLMPTIACAKISTTGRPKPAPRQGKGERDRLQLADAHGEAVASGLT